MKKVRQRTPISLGIFIALLLCISLAGYKGIALITEFLTEAPKHMKTLPDREPIPVTIEPTSR